jgi:hypothetical protein
MYKTVINSYEVIIRNYGLHNNTPICTVYVPELDIYDTVPQSIIEIIPV